MYKNWLIGILAVLLVAVGYFWSTSTATQRRLNSDLRSARSRIATLEKRTTRPAGTTPAPAAEESKAGTQKDPTGTKGCQGCHPPQPVNGKDYSVTAELKKVSGHPTVSTASTAAPKVCVTCHTASGKPAVKLATAIHKPHLTSKIYTKEFDTNCLGCHQFANGQIGVKGLAAAGTSTASTGGASTGTSG